MDKQWNPYTEADENLDKYYHFFDRDAMNKIEDPVETENFLTENCPQNYCYVWLYVTFNDPNIKCQLIGVPEDIAFAIKLLIGADLVDTSNYTIRKRHDGKFEMAIKEYDWN